MLLITKWHRQIKHQEKGPIQKNAITNELENNEESTQLNRSENMSCGANKRISKNFPPVEPFHHAYHVGKVLGKGGFGVVYEGTRIRDGLQVALKHISKSKITEYGQVSNYHSAFYSTYICIIKCAQKRFFSIKSIFIKL